MFDRILIVGMLILAVGCEGEIGVDGDVAVDDDDAGVGTDTSMPSPDMNTNANNSGVDTLCIGVTCLPNAVCGRGECHCEPGFMGDPNTGCVPGNPCDGVTCDFGATCDNDGECPCDPGFVDDGIGCFAEEIVFPADRTQEQVCARWTADYPEQAGVQWQVEPTEQCEVGELDPAFQLDAVRRVTLYRWLVGLPPVTARDEYKEWTQACATMYAAVDGGVAIEVNESLSCYSEDASFGAAGSNLLRAPGSAAQSVDVFMEDAGVAQLSHRRWILNPEMGSTAFGTRASYTCMYALDDNGEAAPMYVAYPFGVFPDEALLGVWSFSSATLGLDGATVSIVDAAGSDVPVTDLYVTTGNFGQPTIAWSVDAAAAPNTYTVTVSGLTGDETEVVYDVQLVSCP